MAENIKVGVDVDDGGSTKKIIKDATELKRAYDDVTHSVKATKAAMAPKTTAAAKAASQSSSENAEYGIVRSAVGTGAAGRDFAKQSQGLGGLVHVYATFAANLFAVGAAFRALEDAMNTSNLVKGLDQLGAASGRSLGTLAKDMVKVTDGALSMRDAMAAVALSSSGGMGNKQILEMAEVGKKASQALGISMPDAISRLSRGITKLEPELLDELGIMVRVDTATSKYAASVGKTVASLSDLEKRQAFANAVLQEGKDKFSNIDIPANPYDKLLASMTNVAEASLSIVNTLLGPIVKLLAESPTALAGAFVYIGSVLLRQAIPALGAWRENLRKSADDSAANAKRIRDAFQAYSIEKDLKELDQRIGPLQKSINDKISNAQTLLANTLSSKSKILARAMSGNVDADLLSKDVSRELTRRQTILKTTQDQMAAETNLDSARKAAYDKLLVKQNQDILNLQNTLGLLKKVGVEQKQIADDEANTIAKKPKFWTQEWMKSKVAEYAEQKSISKNILAQVGDDTKTKGVGAAFSNLFDNINNGLARFDAEGKKIDNLGGKLKGLSKITTGVAGSFVIVGEALGTAMAAFAPYIAAIGVLVMLYDVFDSKISAASKQQEDFNSKVQDNDAAVKTASETFDLYNTKKKEAFSLNSVTAFSSALTQVSDSLASQIVSFDKFNEAANSWDRFKQDLAKANPFSESNVEQLVTSATKDVLALVKTLEFSSNKAKAVGNIAENILKIDPKDINNIKVLESAFEGLTDAQKIQKVRELSKSIDEVAKQEAYAANAAKGFSESLKEVGKITDQIIAGNQFTDLQGKLGVELVNAAERFGQALADPLKSLQSISDIGSDPKLLSTLSKESLDFSRQGVALIAEINQAKSEIEKIKQGKAPGISVDTSINPDAGGVAIGAQLAKAKKLKDEQKQALADANSNLAKIEERAKEFATSIGPKLLADMYAAGFAKIEIGLKKAEELAGISVARAQLSVSGAAGAATANREYDLRIKEINIQKDLIKASYESQLAVMDNTAKLAELTALQTKELTAKVLAPESKATVAEKDAARTAQIGAEFIIQKFQTVRMLDRKEDVSKVDPKVLLAAQQEVRLRTLPEKQLKSALSQQDANIAIAGIERENKLRAESVAKTERWADLLLQGKNSQIAEVAEAEKRLGFYDETLSLREKLLADDKAQLDLIKQQAPILSAIEALEKSSTKNADDKKRLLELQAQKQGNIDAAANAASVRESEFLKKKQEGEAAIRLYITETANIDKAANDEISKSKITTLEQQITLRSALGLISEYDAAKQRAQIELDRIQIETSTKLKSIADERLKITEQQKGLQDLLKSQDPEIAAAALVVNNILQDRVKALDQQKSGVEAVSKAQTDAANLNVTLQNDYVKTSKVIQGAFQGAADALVEFARTGKLSFSDLINSMLADILRIQMRKQFESLFNLTAGTSWFSTIVGGVSGTPKPSAHGNVFDGGLQRFAQGGMFTNSIVNTPTLFKFANGTGLMGEAGPEAIMPLKRDGQGNLGVRSNDSGTKVDVVVNNYSTAQATTKETTDSRGNRKIEVVIGDIVAGEITRTGSFTQQAMLTGYGTRPAITRR